MKPTEFFYWLQGYFELSGPNSAIDSKQATTILCHIQLISENERGAGVYKIQALAEIAKDHGLDVTSKIKAAVSDVFEHVIDPLAGPQDVQDKLNNIHGKTTLIRC